MTIELPALSRRTFLRGMGATIAVTSACGAVEYFSILAPLSIALLVDGDSAVGSLRGFINSPLFNPGRVFVSSATLRDRVDKVLRVERPGLPCLDLPSANARSSDLCQHRCPWSLERNRTATRADFAKEQSGLRGQSCYGHEPCGRDRQSLGKAEDRCGLDVSC